MLSQAEIEHELRSHGSGYAGGKQRILQIYETQPDRKQRAKALAKEYGIGGHSHSCLDGRKGFITYNSSGMEFSLHGVREPIKLKWTAIERYLDLMIQSGRYLTAEEQEQYSAVRAAHEAGNDTELAYAKALIHDFCVEEYDAEPDFSDLSRISIVYTTVTDDETPLQVYVDLNDYKLEWYLEDTLVKTHACDTLSELIEKELRVLDFVELVEAADVLLGDYHSSKEEAAPEQGASVLAKSIPDTEISPEERFTVYETENGYAVWDELSDGPYQEDGIQEEFAGEWEAADYRKALIERHSAQDSTKLPETHPIAARFRSTEKMQDGFVEDIAVLETPNGKFYNHYHYDEAAGMGAGTAGPFDTLEDARQTVRAHRPDAQELPLPLSLDAANEYNALKERYPDALVGFEQHGNYEFYGADAKNVSELLDSRLLEKETPLGNVPVAGFPTELWVSSAKKLWAQGNSVYLAGENENGTHFQTKHLRREDYLPRNAQVHLDGRTFRVDAVNFQRQTATLQDMTLAEEARYPLFREESLPFVRELYEQEEPVSENTVYLEGTPHYHVGDEVVAPFSTKTIRGTVGYIGEIDVRIDTSAYGHSWDNETVNRAQFEEALRRDAHNAHLFREDVPEIPADRKSVV